MILIEGIMKVAKTFKTLSPICSNIHEITKVILKQK